MFDARRLRREVKELSLNLLTDNSRADGHRDILLSECLSWQRSEGSLG